MPATVIHTGDEAGYAAPAVVSALTTVPVPGPPAQLQVSDATGLLATLTAGAKTVTVRGQSRTFTEQKRPSVDDFGRTVSNGWGLSPGAGNWLNLTGTDTNFSVDGTQGLILNDVANTGRYVSLNDNAVADISAAVKLTVSKAATGASSSVGVTFGYTDSSNHYRARLLVNTTGTLQLALEKVVSGTTTTLGAATTVGTGFTAGQWWWVRVQRTGTTIRCRAWQDGTSEPGTWTFTITDTTFPTGRVGIRSFASTGSTAVPFNTQVDTVHIDSCAWATPPAVTHTTWVRVLDAPWDGQWTPALADRIRTWATSAEPDALAYAAMYMAGAPPVTDAALGGPVYGQALYGPTAADGTRVEFSDWNDFAGVGWTYPNGETRTFPHGSVTASGGLDCSGYVRMIYGRSLGVPMVFDLNFDGTNLPRRTRDIGPSGPGIVIQQATGTAPPLTGMQIGDLVLFDADQTEPVEGQTDHVGIYLGTDSAGHPRFISSRKTVNGPTLSDVGGASLLDGTGTYATRLRIIRRI